MEAELERNRQPLYLAPHAGGWVSVDPRTRWGESNLYRYVNNMPTMATDPSGLEIRLYMSPVSSGQGHITIMWFDPAKKIAIRYDGGGPAAKQGTKKLRTPLQGVDEVKDPDQFVGSKAVMIVKTEKTAQQERDALEKAFQETDQIPVYSALWGITSNTYASALLRNAGFPVSDVPGARGWGYPTGSIDGYGGLNYTRYGKPTTEAQKRAWHTELAKYSFRFTPEQKKIMNSRHFK